MKLTVLYFLPHATRKCIGIQYGPKLTPRYQWLELAYIKQMSEVAETEVRFQLQSEAVSFAFESSKMRDALMEAVTYFKQKQELAEEQKSGRSQSGAGRM